VQNYVIAGGTQGAYGDPSQPRYAFYIDAYGKSNNARGWFGRTQDVGTPLDLGRARVTCMVINGNDAQITGVLVNSPGKGTTVVFEIVKGSTMTNGLLRWGAPGSIASNGCATPLLPPAGAVRADILIHS
jgi:hypothetical protein